MPSLLLQVREKPDITAGAKSPSNFKTYIYRINALPTRDCPVYPLSVSSSILNTVFRSPLRLSSSSIERGFARSANRHVVSVVSLVSFPNSWRTFHPAFLFSLSFNWPTDVYNRTSGTIRINLRPKLRWEYILTGTAQLYQPKEPVSAPLSIIDLCWPGCVAYNGSHALPFIGRSLWIRPSTRQSNDAQGRRATGVAPFVSSAISVGFNALLWLYLGNASGSPNASGLLASIPTSDYQKITGRRATERVRKCRPSRTPHKS